MGFRQWEVLKLIARQFFLFSINWAGDHMVFAHIFCRGKWPYCESILVNVSLSFLFQIFYTHLAVHHFSDHIILVLTILPLNH